MKLNLDLFVKNNMSSENRFGYEWNKYNKIEEKYESQFLGWIYPLTKENFFGKKILDAGCGMGRNSFWPLKWGASKVVAFDFDQRSVNAAKKNLKEFPNAEVYFKSVYNVEWHEEFDLAYSIGVIHHLQKPEEALNKLFNSVKLGGKLLIWVYSYEGNEWIVKYVNSIRKNITSRLPVAVVHFLSYLCSIPLWLFVNIYRGGNKYLKQLAGFKFWHIHSIVFDQLIPEVANYWKKEEVEKLFSHIKYTELDIHQPQNKSGWIAIVKK